MGLFKNIKKNRPSVSLGLLKELGLPGMVNAKDSDLGFEKYLEKLMFAKGVNHIVQINDCEDNGGYSESADGVFDLETFAATGKRVGTNCLLMQCVTACDNSQYIQLLNIDESQPIIKNFGHKQMDWSDTRYMGFWIHNASDAGSFSEDGELQVAIVSNGVLQTKVEIAGVTDAIHQWVQIDMQAQGWDLTKVEALRFYSNNPNTTETIYIDDILRYQISYNDAPLYGCAFPVKSGTTITNGNNVRWTVDGLTNGDATQVVNDLGMAEVFGSSLVGRAQRDRWAMIPGLQIFLGRVGATVVEGEGLIFKSVTTMEGVTEGEDETVVCKALEAGDASDDIFCVRGLGGTYISA